MPLIWTLAALTALNITLGLWHHRALSSHRKAIEDLQQITQKIIIGTQGTRRSLNNLTQEINDLKTKITYTPLRHPPTPHQPRKNHRTARERPHRGRAENRPIRQRNQEAARQLRHQQRQTPTPARRTRPPHPPTRNLESPNSPTHKHPRPQGITPCPDTTKPAAGAAPHTTPRTPNA